MLKNLQKEKYKTNISTDGIDINKLKIDDLEFSTFDFGGQEGKNKLKYNRITIIIK